MSSTLGRRQLLSLLKNSALRIPTQGCIPAGSIWQHNKTRIKYLAISSCVCDENTGQVLVLYVHLEDWDIMWASKLEDFQKTFTNKV
jgi:hypothetical protein